MSGFSNYFNVQAAAPSWRLAKWALGAAALSVVGVAVGGTPVIVDAAGALGLFSAVASIGAIVNGVRQGFVHRAPSPPSARL